MNSEIIHEITSWNSHQIDDTDDDDDDGEDPDSALPTETDALNALKIVARFYETRENDEANIEQNCWHRK